MKRSILLSQLLQIRHTGDTDAPTYAFDADGGTAAGQLTLVDDTGGTTTFDLGSGDYDTLSELVTGVQALDEWDARICLGAQGGLSLKTADLTRAFTDTASIAADSNVWKSPISFTNEYEEIAASSTEAPSSRQAVDVRSMELCALQFKVTGADAGAAGDMEMIIQGNTPDKHATAPTYFQAWPQTFVSDYDVLDSDEWDTVEIDGEILKVALNGATVVRKSFTLDVHGVDFIRLGQITNPDDAAVQVKAWLTI